MCLSFADWWCVQIISRRFEMTRFFPLAPCHTLSASWDTCCCWFHRMVRAKMCRHPFKAVYFDDRILLLVVIKSKLHLTHHPAGWILIALHFHALMRLKGEFVVEISENLMLIGEMLASIESTFVICDWNGYTKCARRTLVCNAHEEQQIVGAAAISQQSGWMESQFIRSKWRALSVHLQQLIQLTLI